MGADLIIVVFACCGDRRMAHHGSHFSLAFALGLIEGLTKVFYQPAASTVIFFLMVLVLLFRPAGLFGKEK